jgi:carbamoyltransferase
LGKEWTDAEIGKYLKEHVGKKYKIRKCADIEDEVAKLLASGEVVARFNGRAEWGARALGNRSILANPSDFNTIKLINEMIKNRDFWMPFTPSMLAAEEKRYTLNPKKVFAPYMAITFESTAEAQRDLPAAMHPYDHTIRPQMVLKEWNQSYHKLITAFKKRTGIGGVLNTSFNLHGEPNVNSPADAIHTMDNSGLRNLAIGSWLVQK